MQLGSFAFLIGFTELLCKASAELILHQLFIGFVWESIHAQLCSALGLLFKKCADLEVA